MSSGFELSHRGYIRNRCWIDRGMKTTCSAYTPHTQFHIHYAHYICSCGAEVMQKDVGFIGEIDGELLAAIIQCKGEKSVKENKVLTSFCGTGTRRKCACAKWRFGNHFGELYERQKLLTEILCILSYGLEKCSNLIKARKYEYCFTPQQSYFFSLTTFIWFYWRWTSVVTFFSWRTCAREFYLNLQLIPPLIPNISASNP